MTEKLHSHVPKKIRIIVMLRHDLLYIRRETFTSYQMHLYFMLCLETLSSRRPLRNNNEQLLPPRAAGPTPTTSRRPPAPWRRHDALPRSRPPASVAARICGANDAATGLAKADATDDQLALGDQEKRHQRQSLLTFFHPDDAADTAERWIVE